MHWNVPRELTPQERRLVGRMRRKSKFYVFLRDIRGELFDDDFEAELMAAYEPRGQMPVPPALLAMVLLLQAMVLLLQAYTGLSDADAIDGRQTLPPAPANEYFSGFMSPKTVLFRNYMIEC